MSLQNDVKFFCREFACSPLFIHSAFYIGQYERRAIYLLMLWLITQCYLILLLKLFQL